MPSLTSRHLKFFDAKFLAVISIGGVLMGIDLFGSLTKTLVLLLIVLSGLLLWRRLLNFTNWSGVIGTNFRFPFGDWPSLLSSKDGLYLLRLCKKLGNPHVYRIWMGAQPTLMLAHPDVVSQFWQYHDETKIEREVKFGWALLEIMGEGIGFKPYRARNRISKFFHACFGPKNASQFYKNIENEVNEFMMQLRNFTNHDTIVDISKKLSYLGHDAGNHFFLGPKSSRHLNTLHELVDEMHHLMNLTYDATWINVIGLRWILPHAFKLHWKIVDFRHKWESLLHELMSEYREDLNKNKNDEENRDNSMLARYVQMDAEGKCDVSFKELMDTFTEGLLFPSDITTATTVYTLILLAMNQDVQTYTRELLCNQLTDLSTVTLADINSIEYLDWILIECQRMFPVQMFNTPEFTSQAMTLGNVFVPKNTRVSYDVHSMQRREDIWGDPLVFRPERFRVFNAKQRKAIHGFGNGRTRRCLGEYFVKALHKLLVVRILLYYRVETIDNYRNIDEVPRERHPFFYGPNVCLRFVPL